MDMFLFYPFWLNYNGFCYIIHTVFLCTIIIDIQVIREVFMLKNIITNFKKYQFLLSQLVSRDFKVKYKRSILGVLWSLLYPILTEFSIQNLP